MATAVKKTKRERLKKEFKEIQDYWSKKAKKKGIRTEKDLCKHLRG